MNVETTIALCASGAWHGGSPARLQACVTIASVLCCAGCLRLLAGVLDGSDAGFGLVGRGDAGAGDRGDDGPQVRDGDRGDDERGRDFAEAHSDTGHEVQA